MLSRTALVTGCLGQDGKLLCELLSKKGYRVVGTSHRAIPSQWSANGVDVCMSLNLEDAKAVHRIVAELQPNEIYLLASRSSSASLMQDAIATTLINGASVIHFLEAVRTSSPQSRVCFAASSEMFAGVVSAPQSEKTLACPVNFYGAAKTLAFHMLKIYRQSLGIHAGAAILYNHESIYREPHYVTRKITTTAARIKLGLQNQLVLGNIDAQRDWMHAKDAVFGMWLMLQQEVADDYVFGSGELHSVEDVCKLAFEFLDLDYKNFIHIQAGSSRRSESVQLVADTAHALKKLDWRTTVSFEEMIREMTEFDFRIQSTGLAH